MENRMQDVPGWEAVRVDGVERLMRVFHVDDFADAVALCVKIAMLAEKADHHPSMVVEWGRLQVSWWSHQHKGITQKDFEMAAATSALYGL